MKGTKKRCYYIVIAWHVIIWIFIDDACTIALEGERSFFESCKNYSLMQGLPTKKLSTHSAAPGDIARTPNLQCIAHIAGNATLHNVYMRDYDSPVSKIALF